MKITTEFHHACRLAGSEEIDYEIAPSIGDMIKGTKWVGRVEGRIFKQGRITIIECSTGFTGDSHPDRG